MVDDVQFSREEVRALIEEKRGQLNFQTEIPEALQSDPEVIGWVLKRGGVAFSTLPEAAQNNREVALLYAAKRPYELRSFPEKFVDDREIALAAMTKGPSCFEHLSERLRRDRELVQMALASRGDHLRHVTCDELRHDRALLKLALSTHSQAFLSIPEDLRDDEELLSLVIQDEIDSLVFELFPEAYRDQREVALKAVSNDSFSLRHVSARLSDDEEIVRSSVQQRGKTLEYASERLRDDVGVVHLALTEGGDTYSVVRAMSDRLKNDKSTIIAAVSLDNRVLDQFPDKFRADRDVAMACMAERRSGFGDALYIQGHGYKLLSDALRADRDIALTMSAGVSFPLQDAPEIFKADREIVLNAVGSEASNYQHVAPELLADVNFVRSLYEMNNKVVAYMEDALKTQLFTTRIATSVHRDKRVVIELVIDDGGVKQGRRAANAVHVEQNGHRILTCADYTLISYEDDGPVGSYLSERFLNNIVLCGDFIFHVSRNSEEETFTHHLAEGSRKDYYGLVPAQKNDDFLKHAVHLIDPDRLTNGLLDIRQPGPGMRRIYFGRKANLPSGLQAFRDGSEYRSALTILNQEKQYGEPAFERISAAELLVPNHEVSQLAGAARVYLDDHGWRWLLPNDGGAFASLEVLTGTDDIADWAWLKPHAANATAQERAVLIDHFSTTSLAAEVQETCK